MSESSKFHPAITVHNIKTLIPITLDMDNGQYSSWAELFQINCRAFQVLDHIIPPKDASSSSTVTQTEGATNTESWERLDAIVLQWIYGTISNDLLHTILKPGTTAQLAWERIKNIFHDNKNTRAVHLNHKFTNTRLDDFPNVSAYCQELKVLADQLGNVGPAIEEDRLVLQLITGLNDSYDTVGSYLSHTKPLLSFYEARSALILEETRKQQQASHSVSVPDSAMVATTNTTPKPPSNPPSSTPSNNRNTGQYNRGRGSHRGNYRGRNNSYRGRGGRGYNTNPGYTNGPSNQPWTYGTWAWQSPHWASPPCPYPTTNGPRPSFNSFGQQGLLGPRPQQQSSASYAHSVSSATPTDIESAMYTMSLNPPDDNWYMDTGATSHMTGSSGISDGNPHNAK